MGSEFEVYFPIAASAPPEPTTAVRKPQVEKRLRVLVVDDNHDAAEALMMLLEMFGHDATMFFDGVNAIEAVGKATFDLALVDIGLPGIDGYEVARRIRMLPSAKPMRLVALTGYGQDSDKQRALAAGFDEHLTKPVKIEQLQALLARPR
jgi:CheY-like chemotaxis protein